MLQIHQPTQNAAGSFLSAILTKKAQNWTAKQKKNQY
jgi:hypothetical protein